ncbi:MAG TPA: glycosyltransferase family 4 protein [Ramlibacter sp.]|jgi:glycosyltransferase involved in cell wall biosynthesis|nr:glycosyltransferase family 4 protein [Ramlibacter sp.]
MRVCFVVTNTFALNAFLAVPIEALAAAGWEVTVAVSTRDGEVCELVRRNAQVYDLHMNRHISPVADMPVVRDLYRFIRRQSFDVVHSITPKAGVLGMTTALLARVPVRMHTFTGQVWVNRSGFMKRFLQFMEWYVAHCANHVLADSPSQAQFLIDHHIVEAQRMEVLAEGSICGVDTLRFRPRPGMRAVMRARLGVPEGAPMLLYVGRLHPEKGLHELGVAFERLAAKHTDAHLVLVGPDETGLAQVQAKVVRARDRVHAVGRSSEPEHWMAAADVLCLPSYREGFGMSLLEGAAAGLPSVASRIYGVTDAVVDGETGLLVPARDPIALADALERLVVDGELRRRLGAAARERALRSFSKEVMQQAWTGMYARRMAELGRSVQPHATNA